jgi:TP901 family phage tail tape measure protein
MADVNANIDINIDSSNALAQLKALQRQISQFHTSIARSSEAAALAQKGLQKNLLNSINAIGAFTAEMRTVRTSAESFTDSLEKNKFSMREYFRYAGASTKTFGRLFKSEFDTIGKVAEERVKTLQTQYIKMGRNASGAMEAIAIRPTSLNMQDYGTKTAIAAQKQALFNQLMKQGSTNLLNFGKNTQWSGRQLMVGFTLPLMAVGSAASKAFMDMEAQALRFRKVYGDLFTPKGETQRALEDITELGKQFTKYGVAVSTTVGLAAEAAAAGFQGLDLQRQTTEATRLSILGQVDSQKALETTISLQNAFGMSSEKLADSINFLNAVENQTVVSLDDITTAIPKVAPVIKQLGGDVKDLTFFIAAMKEGGINASEGANALKSGLAALINPTKKASDMLASFGINATAIVEKNKGNLKATVVEFANALNTLDPLSRARAIEQMFGKFQFARLSTLFANVARDGNQASRVLDLANASVEELSALSEQELGMTADSAMNKFKKTVEDLKVALVPVGQAFLEALTPIIEFVNGILEKFSNLSSGTKRIITLLTVGIGAIGPVLLMTFGLLANGIANIIKLFLTLRGGYQRLTGQTSILGEQTQYMTMEQLDAAAAAHSLNQTHATLTQTFTAETAQIAKLIAAYNSAAGAARNFAMNNPGMMMPGKGLKKFAQGGIISGPGGPTSDSVPVMASDGEAIISAKTVKKYPGIIDGLISGNIPGFKRTGVVGRQSEIPIYAENAIRLQDAGQNMRQQSGTGTGLYNVLANLVARVGESRGIPVTLKRIEGGQFDDITEEYREVTQKFVDKLNTNYDHVIKKVSDTNKAYAIAWKQAGKAVESEVNSIQNDAERGAVRRVFGLEKDIYSTIPTAPRSEGGNMPERARKGAFKRNKFGISSYTSLRPSIKKLFERQSGQSAANLQMGHVFDSKQVNINQLMRDPLAASGVKDAAKVMGIEIANNATEGFKQGAKQVLAAASPSKEMKEVGQDAGRGVILGAQEYVDDAKIVGQQLGGGMVKTASGLILPSGAAGQPGSVAANAPRPGVPMSVLNAAYEENAMRDLAKKQQQRIAIANQRMNSLNKAFMSGTFALSALSGVASMAGGNLGKFSEILFKISGPLFALSSVIQLLTGEKIVKYISRFRVGFGLASVALLAGIGIIKLVNSAREKELEYIYGLSNAMKTTTNQVKTLGDFFNIVPSKLPSEMKNKEIVGQQTRSKRDQLRESEAFKKDFAPTIKTLSTATAEEAKLAFTSLAFDLKARGFATEQIQTIVDALREEAGKTDVKLDVKSLSLNEDGLKQLKAQIAPLIFNFEKEMKTGAIKKSQISRATGELVTWTEYTSKAKKAMEELATFNAGMINSIGGMFRLGVINSKEFETSIYGILDTFNVLNEEQRKMALLDLFKKMDIDVKNLLPNLTNAANTMKVLAVASMGLMTPGLLKGLASNDLQVLAEAFKELDRLYANFTKTQEKFNQNNNNGGVTGGKGQPNALQKMITEIENQTKAFDILIKKRIEYKQALELSNNAEIANLLILAKKNGTLPQTIALVKELNRVTKLQESAQLKALPADEKKLIELDYLKKQVELREAIIDAQFAPQIKKENDALDAQEKKLAGINKQIEDVRRKQIEPIQNLIDSNNYALQVIALQEDAINEKYNKEIEALDKIEKANQNIANIQKQRMSIADALTRGDISAAAQAVQEARAERAQSALTGQRDILTRARDERIEALGRIQLEKQNKVLQLEIATIEKNQLTILESQKTTIENTIAGHTANLTALRDEVVQLKETYKYGRYTKSEIESLEGLILKARAAGILFTDELIKQAEAAERLAAALAAQQAKGRSFEELRAGVAAGTITKDSITKAEQKTIISGIGTYVRDLNAKIAKIIKPQKKMYGGVILPQSKGGMGIVKTMAFGGRAVGSDTVPAMLTPGEFIMNKAASKAYRPLLERMNESKYPGMLNGGGMTQIPVNNITTSMNDNSTAVYNYNLGFSINGANGNANDIARAVMREIKNVDSQRIRRQRV